MTACNRFEWLLPALFDGDAEAARHLDECVTCREAHAEMKAFLDQLPASLPLGPVPDLRSRVRARIDALPHDAPGWLRRHPWAPVLLVAACLTVAVTVPLLRAPVSEARSGALNASSASAPENSVGAAFDDALLSGLQPDSDSSDLTSLLLESASPSDDDLPKL